MASQIAGAARSCACCAGGPRCTLRQHKAIPRRRWRWPRRARTCSARTTAGRALVPTLTALPCPSRPLCRSPTAMDIRDLKQQPTFSEGTLRSSWAQQRDARAWSSSSLPPAPASMSRTSMGTGQYFRLQRLCDIRAGCRLPGQIDCAHRGCGEGSRACGRAAHRRRRRPRSQQQQWVPANIPGCNGCAIFEPAAYFVGRCTALMLAADQGKTLVVEQLIAAGAGLDVKDNNGYEPIYPTATAVRYPSRQPIRRQGHCAHQRHMRGAHRHHSRSHLRWRRCRCVEQRWVRPAPTRLWVQSRKRSSALHPGRETAEAVSEAEGKSAQYVEAVRKVRRVEHSRSALGLCRPGPLPAGGGWGSLVVGLTSGLRRRRCGHCSAPFGIGTF